MSAIAVTPRTVPGHEDLLPEDRLDAHSTATWRPDLVGYRAQAGGDRMIFRCACGCGGHTAIPVAAYAPLGRARAAAHARWATKAAWGAGFYITGHAPEGIAAQKHRQGPQVALKATA